MTNRPAHRAAPVPARWLAEYTDDGLVVRETGLSCCPYLMGGRFRGLETWITPPEPDLRMISRMQFVPHFIRS